jgi:magnesium chelatase family protein
MIPPKFTSSETPAFGCLLAFAFSAALSGVDAHVVRVQSDSAAGVPAFAIVWLAYRALNESRERVRAAIVNSGFGFPPGLLLVNLAPRRHADMPTCEAVFNTAGRVRIQRHRVEFRDGLGSGRPRPSAVSCR